MKEIYNILAGAMGQESRMNQIANNLANASTAGFKRDGIAFNDYLKNEVAKGDASGASAGASPQTGAHLPSIPIPVGDGFTDFSAGPAVPTNAPLDLMIEGEGFFQIEGASAGAPPSYTRGGSFSLNADREVITSDGRRLLDAQGSPIRLDGDARDLSIKATGEIYNGASQLGKLQIVTFEDPSSLTKLGSSLFAAPEGIQPVNADKSFVRQGVHEGSNVSPITEMVRMIETQRSYEAHLKAMQTSDDLIGKRIGSILNR